MKKKEIIYSPLIENMSKKKMKKNSTRLSNKVISKSHNSDALDSNFFYRPICKL